MNVLFASTVLSIWLACVTAKPLLMQGDKAIRAIPHQFPWMVRMDRTDIPPVGIFQQGCGCSLIRTPVSQDQSDVVLTAAHCIHESFPDYDEILDPSKIQLVAGAHWRNQTESGAEEIRRVHRMKPHPKYNIYSVDVVPDIALIQLDRPINFSSIINPIELPLKGHHLGVGQICTVAGWGATREEYNGYTETPDVLMHTNVTITSISQWHYRAAPFRHGLRNWEKFPGACGGDSGGPLFRMEGSKWVVHGVLSGGPSCSFDFQSEPTKPGGDRYTKLEPFLDWIEETMKDWIEN